VSEHYLLAFLDMRTCLSALSLLDFGDRRE
jgi:hypothetical protein